MKVLRETSDVQSVERSFSFHLKLFSSSLCDTHGANHTAFGDIFMSAYLSSFLLFIISPSLFLLPRSRHLAPSYTSSIVSKWTVTERVLTCETSYAARYWRPATTEAVAEATAWREDERRRKRWRRASSPRTLSEVLLSYLSVPCQLGKSERLLCVCGGCLRLDHRRRASNNGAFPPRQSARHLANDFVAGAKGRGNFLAEGDRDRERERRGKGLNPHARRRRIDNGRFPSCQLATPTNLALDSLG